STSRLVRSSRTISWAWVSRSCASSRAPVRSASSPFIRSRTSRSYSISSSLPGEAVLIESCRSRSRKCGAVIGLLGQCPEAPGPEWAYGSGEAGELTGEPAGLVLELAERDLEVGVLLLQRLLLGRQADVPVADLVVEATDLVVASGDDRR